jgi:hypothetical protein
MGMLDAVAQPQTLTGAAPRDRVKGSLDTHCGPRLLIGFFFGQGLSLMKCRSLIAYTLVAGLCLFYDMTLAAQDSPRSPLPAGAVSSPASDASALPPANTASMRTSKGEVTINSAPASKPLVGTAPPFVQLSHGAKVITAAQAEAYPPLANDFSHADSNRDGTVDAAEYAHWIKQL